ncbi:tyrosine--tRNA ligase [Candidatus Contubernalis alkaliaceticus]|uniref:tyrosine--tRNA ligase n=1 Tax=Candidatus Contubernalis alkaliaceticus TaxID=338645 RepID=UPI001F4C32BB|nr:tyrosine--tRNA ligase [Candidatus Contubernalis alkalaceticus]UNC92638.1 tyrosine--tRNA ligase [Candidatus Contubernalis alkalaceticus]
MNAQQQFEIIKGGTVEILQEDDLLKKLEKSIKTGKPLIGKLGFDPSAPDLHLGHAVVLHKIKDFQDLGHDVVIILGDFTGRIGDPTGRSETRKQLTEEEVIVNAKTYQEQIFKILDPDKTRLVFNSEWLQELNFVDVIELSSKYTVARMLERDDFSKRFKENYPISIHEFFYPLMQGYDSVAIEADVEFGATEQKFNLLMGRHLQKEYGQQPQIAITMPILVGLDGVKKMSKSLGNYIGISEPPAEIYGKAMSIADEFMMEYFRLATRLDSQEILKFEEGLKSGELHPRDLKMKLARELVAMYYSESDALLAEQNFQKVFKQKEIPSEIPEVILEKESVWIVKLLTETGLVPSKSEARRMVKQGAVKFNGEKVTDIEGMLRMEDGAVLQVGKRKFVRVLLK